MKNITLGSTGITVPQNGFGALPMQRVSNEYAVGLLRRAYEAGITYFDSARSYTDSETKIGLAFTPEMRKNIFIATKTHAKTAEEFRQHLHTSLTNMKTDYIDLYQFHNPAFCPKSGDGTGLYEAMLEAKAQGKIRHIGITNHRLGVAEEAVRSGLYETLQFPFCYLATEKDIALVNLCREKNVGFIAMKGLSGGLITNAEAAYAYIGQYDNVLPIWGVQRMSELEEFIGFFENTPTMTPGLSAVIAKDREELVGNFCRACGYCMPCTVGIKISDCARMSQLIRRSPSAQHLTPESRAEMMKIENCINCGHCTSMCPYELDTPTLLRRNLEDYKKILSGEVKI